VSVRNLPQTVDMRMVQELALIHQNTHDMCQIWHFKRVTHNDVSRHRNTSPGLNHPNAEARVKLRLEQQNLFALLSVVVRYSKKI
jgi:hypothetical protein